MRKPQFLETQKKTVLGLYIYIHLMGSFSIPGLETELHSSFDWLLMEGTRGWFGYLNF
jgi:hypothetical protein